MSTTPPRPGSDSPDTTHVQAAAPPPQTMEFSNDSTNPTFGTLPPGGVPGYPFLSQPQAPDEIGRLGEYRILKKLGEGGMGFVFRGEDPGLKRFIALKVMRPEVAAKPLATDRFLREGRAAAGLKSDHIITIYQVGQANGVPFLAMEFLEGLPLDEWFKQQKKAIPLPHVLRVVRDTLRGLATAHDKGLIHRDIKPANLWLEKGTSRIKLLDFGLTRGNEADMQLTQEGAVVGTPAFMAPEQASGKPVDPRADLFSVGTVMYLLLAGKNPFSRGNLMETLGAVGFETQAPIAAARPDVPKEYSDFLDRLLAKNPDGRPAHAKAALQELAAIEKGLQDGNRTISASTASQPVVAVPLSAPTPQVWDAITDADVAPPPARPARAKDAGPPKPPTNKKLLLGGGLFALLAVLGGIIIIITNKDGTQTKIEVPDGSKVEVKDKGKTVASVGGKKDDVAKIKAETAPSAEVLKRLKLSDIVGHYADKQSTNDWHRGAISETKDKEGKDVLRWTNAAGKSWQLTPDLPNGVLNTGPDNPYFNNFNDVATRVFTLELSRDGNGEYLPQVQSFRFGGAEFVRKSDGAADPKPDVPGTFTNGIGMEFVKVPKGTGWLGGGSGKPGGTKVEFPEDFYLGKYEVTHGEWEAVMGANPSRFTRTGAGKDAVKDIPDADLKRFPVESMSWDECQLFIQKLNEKEKETGWVYRLPKQAEWEYALRGGPVDKSESAFDFYFAKPTNTLLPEQANFNNTLKRTCKVGSYEPNLLGLYDMHGNVQEHCDDASVDPKGAPVRMSRGGYWDFDSRYLLARHSNAFPASNQSANIGLRLARVPSNLNRKAADPDRAAAEKLLPLFDLDILPVGQTKVVNLKAGSPVPAGAFHVTLVRYNGKEKLPPAIANDLLLPAVTPLTRLTSLEDPLQFMDMGSADPSKWADLAARNSLKRFELAVPLSDAWVDTFLKFPSMNAINIQNGKTVPVAILKRLGELKSLDSIRISNLDGRDRWDAVTALPLKHFSPSVVPKIDRYFCEKVASMPSLERFYIYGVDLSAEMLDTLGGSPSIVAMLFAHSVPPKGIDRLVRSSNLSSLTIKSNGFDDAGLADIVGAKTLIFLSVKETAVTEAGVKALAAKLPNLTIEWSGGRVKGP
jgi:serine/threonine protein kinase/formylglycine-generating enzyme required for sulfatase activity